MFDDKIANSCYKNLIYQKVFIYTTDIKINMSSANDRYFSEGKPTGGLTGLPPEAQIKSKDSKHKECLESRIFSIPHSNQDISEYLHDRDRIIYSRAFRRLASKTQVVTASGGITSDHLRNRLTHSLEVMQIASSIALVVNKKNEIDIDLIQAISLGHDIGHTAYGHVGEKSLYDFLFPNSSNNQEQNEKHRKCHHSFQSLKVCCFLEKGYNPDFPGLRGCPPINYRH